MKTSPAPRPLVVPAVPAAPAVLVSVFVSLFLALATPLSRAEPQAERLGSAQGYPVAPTIANFVDEPYRVGTWSAGDTVPGAPVRKVLRGESATPLPALAAPPVVRYRFRNLGYTLDEYLDRQRVTGVLILKHGQVVTERYRYARGTDSRFLSFSMAKSVISLLVGAAVERGAIASLDDPAEKYARELAGSAYGGTPIRALLRMASGVRFSERYDGNDDISRLSRAGMDNAPGTLAVLRSLNDRAAPPGERFAYSSAETMVLGLVLSGATGRDVSSLTSEWLWQPLGAERDAFWVLSGDGFERAYGFFNATLRDWGRLGAMLAAGGKVGDRQIIPRDYVLDATEAERQPRAFKPGVATRTAGYGYQFWLYPSSFALQGVYGQAMFVQPSSGIVMVHTAVYEHPTGANDPQPWMERYALWQGVLRSLGGTTD